MVLEDRVGITQVLGIVVDNDPGKMILTILALIRDVNGIDTIRLGNPRFNRYTFCDEGLII